MEEIRTFDAIVTQVKDRQKQTIVVAAAEEHDVLAATVHARQEGLCEVVYVGNPDLIRQFAAEDQLDIRGIEIIAESNPQESGKKAVHLIKTSAAQVLMKGKISTHHILELILKDRDLSKGITDHFLSHVTIFEWDGRLKMFSDAALNIAPTLDQKRQITRNTLNVARKLGIACPRVAFLSAAETINPKMSSSVDAAELAQMDWGAAIVGGPLAFDGALFAEAYRIKGVPSPVEGQADILICPNIETGNVLYKVFAWMLKLNLAGTMAGSPVPFILTSRADSAHVKFLSIATTLFLAS